jgi:hypothetical protein
MLLKQNQLSKIFLIALSIIMLVSILPELALSLYTFPLPGDDFNNSYTIKNALAQTGSFSSAVNTAVSETMYLYNNWQGSVAGVMFMKFNPAIFSLAFYRFSMFLLNLIFILCIMFTSHVFLKKITAFNRYYRFFIASLIIFVTYHLLPHPFEFFYWYTGSTLYFLTFSLTISYFALIVVLKNNLEKKRSSVFLTIALCIIGVFLGLNNLPNLVMMFSTLALLLLYNFYYKTDFKKHIALIAGFFLIGAVINIAAPGNYLRSTIQATENLSMVGSLLHSFTYGATYLFKATRMSPVFGILILSTPILLKSIGDDNNRFINPPLFAAISFLVYISQYAPVFYSVGYMPMGRIENLRYLTAQLLVIINYINIVVYIKNKKPRLMNNKVLFSLISIIACAQIAICINNYYLYPSNIQVLLREYKQGKTQTYILEQNKRYQLLEDETIKDVTFDALTFEGTLHHHDKLGTNNKSFINSTKRFYNKNSIIIK